MNKEIELGTQTLNSSTETIELVIRQEPEMDTPAKEMFADELILMIG